ncbi:MAG: 1-deoxy-D-xylulose-5-phosphate synthase N-terminal domain-containing protein [Patescibacteria group bacterium]
MLTKELEAKAAQIRLDTLNALHKGGLKYMGSCMSVVEILVSLYYGRLFGNKAVMNYDAAKPGNKDQDYLVLSKGHAVPVQYAILADLGFFDKSELDFIGKPGAMLKDRPWAKVPGISASMLSYGHGLSTALGLALALKMDRKMQRVFAVLGDGELTCGQVWEAAMMAAKYNLSNLIVFVDNNRVQAGSILQVENLQDKFESFGWQVMQVTDGHNFDQLLNTVSRAFTAVRRPVCIWCHTIVGKGVDFAERKPSYQSANLSDGEMAVIIPKLKELYEQYTNQIR